MFRPGFRRPPLTLNKKLKPSQSNDIAETTESTTSNTRKNSSSSSSPYIRRRSRPTYIPTTSQTITTTISSASRNDSIVNKIIQRRKFGRPSNVNGASVSGATNERKRYTGAIQTKFRSTTESSKYK